MGTDVSPGTQALVAGGGRVGDDMATVDWAATPLGEPEQWPTPLRTVVRMLLTSRFSMWMAWGPELTVFYNDAYWRDTLQSKHPWALGKPARVVWSEIWPDIGPRIASVLDTGVATWDEDLLLFLERSGYSEETYHTFSYSPLADADGGIAGMLCVVTETTERVIGDRRLATMRDLGTAMGPARSREDVLGAVERTLGENDRDLPFSLVYLFDEDAGVARLAATSGVAPGSAVAPATVARGGAWPAEGLTAGAPVLVDDLAVRWGDAVPRGAWDRPATQAVLVPLAAPPGEGSGPAGIAGFLVAGVNPHRVYDDRMASFLELLGGQITAGLANVSGFEAERRRAEALAELDRAKTEFFSNVSHEFRTPLTLIMGPVQELREAREVDPEQWRHELEVVHRNGRRLGRLVNSLLDFSRLDAGHRQAHYVPTDLGAATEELAGMFHSAMERAGLSYVVDCPPLGRPVLLDREAWEKIVLNLLSNALKFTTSGSVSISVEATDDAAVLHVADTGVGVPAGELPRLFERFHRVQGEGARSGEGSGIGLALVRELVGLHGGEVGATSEFGVGTTMTVTLPFDREHGDADPVASEPVPTAGPSDDAESFVAEAMRWLPDPDDAGRAVPDDPDVRPEVVRGRILVADDNADMRSYLHRLLAPHHDVRLVADGEEALAAALADPPELVVSDVMMPRRDGLALLAALRADERTARVPVLLLSARAGQEAAVEGLAAQADDYLVKPFTASELRARVDAHLQLGRARRRAELRFTAMADLAPAMIWVADPDGARTFHNAGWRRFTGRADADERGEGWLAGMHPDDRGRYREARAAAMAAGRGWEIEYRLRRDDNAYHRVAEHAVPVPGETGVSAWVGSVIDVHARWLEAERQRLLARVGAELDGAPEVVDRLERLVRLLVEVGLAARAAARAVDDDGAPGAGRAATATAGADGDVVTTVPLPADGAGEGERRALARRAPITEAGELHLPLTVRDQPVAVLSLARPDGAPGWSEDDLDLVEEIAARAALALDNALLLAEERATAARLSLLQRATTELSAAATPAEVADVTVGHLRSLFGSSARVAVFEFDPRSGNLAPLAAVNVDPPVVTPERESPTMVGAAVDSGEPLWLIAGGPETPEAERLRATLREAGIRGAMALPLVAAGVTVGAIGVGLPDRVRVPRTERITLVALAEPCAIALDRARLYRAEHQIADTLQRSLLPQALPSLDRLGLAVRYLPGATGTQAGGDWYDVVELDEHRVAIAVGDVVGQGTAAAAVMGQLRTALSGYLLAGHGPAEALALLDGLTSRIPGSQASTAMCLTLDTSTGELRHARAGHLPALLAPADGGPSSFLDDPAGHGPLLGLPPGLRDHTEAVTTLEPGSVLLLYTDGLVERRGETLDDGFDRLVTSADRHRAAAPDALAGALLADLGTRSDDVALVVARLAPPPLELTLPARPDALAGLRRQTARWARAVGLTEVALGDLQLALGEAATNAVEHGYRHDDGGGEVEVRLARRADGSTEAAVVDHGSWRPAPADPGFRGRGLTLLREVSRDATVTTSPDGGTRVAFRIEPGDDEPGPATARGQEQEPRPGTPASVAVHDDGGSRRIVLAGDLDLGGAAACHEALLGAVDGVGSLEIDVRGVGHLASAGVGLVLEALQAARRRGGAVRLTAAPGSPAARVLALALPGEA
ncbi:SpoIIE family protein phosphatase [Actinomycetospora lutea]|uniref:SpoIIE family protein phosphatase n=1 Tax=Actinomycetospora lutea TaxID=663604 RepID=UPI0023654AD3|nr:SpoIIE family protein phosphatase [Actinomycetospora lutea]MDD7937080.1 SpoIIE family protein phosphatase [Actinomycetospora lutea]